MAEYWVAGAGKHEPAKVRLRKATFWNHILFFPFGKRAESSLRSGGFHYYSISRTLELIDFLEISVTWRDLTWPDIVNSRDPPDLKSKRKSKVCLDLKFIFKQKFFDLIASNALLHFEN